MDFVKYHKRVTRNFHEALQNLILNSKQTIAKGIASQYHITLDYIRLNKSCTVCNVWWNLVVLHPEFVSDDLRQYQMSQEK